MIFKNTWLYRKHDTVKGRIVFHENNKNKVLTENRKDNIDKEGLFVAFSGLKSVAKLSSYDKVLIDRKTYRRSGEKKHNNKSLREEAANIVLFLPIEAPEVIRLVMEDV